MDKEKERLYGEKYRAENVQKEKIRHKKYHEKNKEKIKIKATRYRKENREKCRELGRRYRKNNPEKEKARHVKYYLENKEKIKMYHKKRYKENTEQIRKRNKIWQIKHPEKTREYNHKKRTRGIIEKGIMSRIVNENILKYGCITCENINGKKEDGHCEHCENGFHIDHIVPISKGGSNDYNNLQILCAHCNYSKHTEIIDYRQDNKNNQMFLKI